MVERRVNPMMDFALARRAAFDHGPVFGAEITRTLIENHTNRLSPEQSGIIWRKIEREELNPALTRLMTIGIDLLQDPTSTEKHQEIAHQMLERSASIPDLTCLPIDQIAASLEEAAITGFESLDLNDPKLQYCAFRYDIARGITLVTSRIIHAGDMMKGTWDSVKACYTDLYQGSSPAQSRKTQEDLDRQIRLCITVLEQDPTGIKLVEQLNDRLENLYRHQPNRRQFTMLGGKFAERAYNSLYSITKELKITT